MSIAFRGSFVCGSHKRRQVKAVRMYSLVQRGELRKYGPVCDNGTKQESYNGPAQMGHLNFISGSG